MNDFIYFSLANLKAVGHSNITNTLLVFIIASPTCFKFTPILGADYCEGGCSIWGGLTIGLFWCEILEQKLEIHCQPSSTKQL